MQEENLYWSPVTLGVPPDRGNWLQSNDRAACGYRYIIGWYDRERRQWAITAKPESDAWLDPIGWIASPK